MIYLRLFFVTLIFHLPSFASTLQVYDGSIQADNANKLPSLTKTWGLNIASLKNDDLGNSEVWSGSVPRKQLQYMSLVSDPSGTNGSVIKVSYPSGSWIPSSPNPGGSSFFANVISLESEIAATSILTYNLYFANNFQWNKGGKLPGIGGASDVDTLKNYCEGGSHSDSCFTVRIMWRANGAGEAYAYLPTSNNAVLCKRKDVICNNDYGISFSRGSINFQTGQWYNVQILTQLNTPGQADGVLAVYVNGTQKMYYSNIQYTMQSGEGVSSLFWSTFFGGSTSDWASPADTYTLFKGVSLSYQSQPAVQANGVAILLPHIYLFMLLVITIIAS